MAKKRPTISFEKRTPKARQGDLEQMFTESAERLRLLSIPIDQIEPDPDQPRRIFDDDSLHSLAESIRESGLIQPIEVIQTDRTRYRIVHGERRWRASKLAQQETIPALVKRTEYDDTTRYVRQLVENMQREDLNDIDRAAGLIHLRELMQAQATEAGETRKISFSKVAEKVGYTRQRVSQLVGLLNLPEEMRQAVQEARVSERDTRLFQALTPVQQQQLFRAWHVEARLSQAELKRVADLIKKNRSLSVERAIATVQTGQDKVKKSREEQQRENNGRLVTQITTSIEKIGVEDLNSADAQELLQTLTQAHAKLKRLIDHLVAVS
jgi:ParB family chromosome partitioning protein